MSRINFLIAICILVTMPWFSFADSSKEIKPFVTKACLNTMNSVKPGMPRRDLPKEFEVDGGLAVPFFQERYILVPCKSGDGFAKMNISFRPKEVDQATFQDPDKFRTWMDKHRKPGRLERPDDVIVKVSEPFWELPYGD